MACKQLKVIRTMKPHKYMGAVKVTAKTGVVAVKIIIINIILTIYLKLHVCRED